MSKPPLAKSQWSIVGASVAGTGHIERNIPCQDAHRIWYGPGVEIVLAVADGAGSAAHAELGSTEAVELGVGVMWAHFLRRPGARANIYLAVKNAFATIRDEMERYAAQKLISLDSLATTLTIVVVMPDCIAVAQTGDGLVATINDLGELKSLAQPQSGEHANETFFITGSGGATPGFVEVYAPAPAAVAVLTDGLVPMAADFKDHKPYPGFFEPMFDAVSQSSDASALQKHLETFLMSDRVNSRTNDDKTLVLAVRKDVPIHLGIKK
jgi:hypothetical protein